MHPDLDQFFRVERGEASFVLSEKEHLVRDGDAVVVPAGTYHNVLNMSKTEPLRLYTIYSPPNHPEGTVHKTKADAEAAMYSRHEEHSAPINASAERVFALLDDQTRLTEHMSKCSWKMGWGRMDTVLDAQQGTLGRIAHRPSWPSIRDSTAS